MESKAAGDEHNILTFCVYEVCILKTVVFPVQNSHSCCRCCCCRWYHFHSYWFAPLSSPTMWARTWRFRAHSEVQSSDNRNIQTVNKTVTLADFTFHLIRCKLQFWNKMWPQILFIHLLNVGFALFNSFKYISPNAAFRVKCINKGLHSVKCLNVHVTRISVPFYCRN